VPVIATATVAAGGVAAGDPVAAPGRWAAVAEAAAPDGSHVVRVVDDRRPIIDVLVYSAAMNRTLTVKVRPAPDASAPAPVVYLLNGADGGADGGWVDKTDMVDFFADKQVTAVVPMGGRGSYFTDWRSDDPLLGRQRWATFLTRELPPIIDRGFRGTGADALAGISMAGTSVFLLALAAPGLYRAIGSYSGCVETSDPVGKAMVGAVSAAWGGNAMNMWGPPADPAWADHDPYLHADRLRGTAIYVSAGNGRPGPFDTVSGTKGDVSLLIRQVLIGGPLERIVDSCTYRLRDRLRQLHIPATFDFRPTGTHSWTYWQFDLHTSWPLFAEALARPRASTTGG
jgi:S-formylglutathione hydrolase FrmB